MPLFGKKQTVQQQPAGLPDDQSADQSSGKKKKKPTLKDREQDHQTLQQQDQDINKSIEEQKATVQQHQSKRTLLDADSGKAAKESLAMCAERDALKEALAKARALRSAAETTLGTQTRKLENEKAEVLLLGRRLERLRVKQAAFKTAVEDSSCLRGEHIALAMSRDSNGLAEEAQKLVRPGVIASEAELAAARSDHSIQTKEHARLQTEVSNLADADPGKHGRLLVSQSYLRAAEGACEKVIEQLREGKAELDASQRAFERLQAKDASLRAKLDAARIELASMSTTYREETATLPSMIVTERAVKDHAVAAHEEKMVQIERVAESHIKSLNASATWVDCRSDFPAPMWSARSAPPLSLTKELELLSAAAPRTKKAGLSGSDLTRTGKYVVGMTPTVG